LYFTTGLIAVGLFALLAAGGYLAAPNIFDWDAYDWPTGYLSQTYPGVGLPATDFMYTFSGDTQHLQLFHSPDINQIITGGLSPSEDSLFIAADFITNTEEIQLTISLPMDIYNVSFTVMDIDAPNGPNGIDKLRITGIDSLGVTRLPILTPADPSCVNISSNVISGLCFVNNNTNNGNVAVEFSSGVKMIYIVFGDAGLVQDLQSHGFALHDITFYTEAPPPTATPTPIPDYFLYLPTIVKN
jgi:hypothetical protein